MPAGLSQRIQSNLVLQLRDDVADPFLGQRILVAGLRRRQQPQILQALVADQRLRKLGNALDDIDQVEHDPPFRPHDKVEIAQADVEIDDHHLLSHLRERRAEGCRGSRLADAAFAGRHDQYFGHSCLLVD